MTDRPLHVNADGVCAPMDDAMFAEYERQQAAFAAAPPPIPDGPTLSDWRVGLLRWGRLDDVTAKIAALADSQDPAVKMAGLEARERFEYANNVYRATLLLLKDAIGFTEADVDESLTRAAAVTAGT